MAQSAMQRMPDAAVEIDLLVEAGAWASEDALRDLAGRVMRAVIDELDLAGVSELSLVFTDDAHIKALNAAWRGKDQPTNVLSFPAATLGMSETSLPPMLGDIIVAYQTVRREADAENKPFDHHLAHLVAHGILHLLGHDHEDDEQADLMESIERRVLARLAIGDPYA
jgi:probable rRNA maturation factor